MKIYKFGGSSLGSAARIRKVAGIIADASAEDRPPVVVVSAIYRVTDLLLEAAAAASAGRENYRQILDDIRQMHERVFMDLFPGGNDGGISTLTGKDLIELYDLVHGVFLLRELSEKSTALLLSFGERLSARIVAGYLNTQGMPAVYIDARELIVTDTNYCNAKVNTGETSLKVRERMGADGAIPVVTGYIAAAPDGTTTTLGRGGSDYTASLIGAALGAEEILIWTDVDGFFSADPRRVRDARVLPFISYAEAMELSHAGAKILHPYAIQPAMKASIPVLIKNSFNPDAPGTRIEREVQRQQAQQHPVTGLSSINRVVLLNLSGSGMVGVPGIASRLFSCLARSSVNVIFISQASSEQSISLAIDPQQAAKAKKALEEEFASETAARLIDPLVLRRNLAMVAVVGNNMTGHPGVSAQLFETLGKNGINVIAVAQGANEMNISVVIDNRDEDKALNCIHESFFLSQRKIHVFIAGTGTIAKSLIRQIEKHRLNLRQEKDLDVLVCGLANTGMIAVCDGGIDLEHWEISLEARTPASAGIEGYIRLLMERNLHNTVFVDCTASGAVAECYPQLLQANISVVTANKLGMAGPAELYESIRMAQKGSNARFLYETNVGAGLPIINTLNDLKNSGDNIISIQGVLSGTLSYIFNELRKGGRFSDIVRKAKEAGYTEPDPRDDLSGADFARKVLILGRELGYSMEYTDVQCESLVPEELRGDMPVGEFLDRLGMVDDLYAERIGEAGENGMTISYAGEIRNGKASIGVKHVPLASPLAGLSGSENMVVFTTDRYFDTPLVVRGPGAGAEVTAGGVFADILRVASYLV
ncbi:MAG: bifunctional aspartate kinase/homoserine dehydrogenase I [Chlorobium sp.]|uniref:bifunctional aspartate kinase/homoserine dehydrogenase I n=1 Tax=Chlorobium sp. TaxID=1095 RepID=UPI002F42486A